MSNFGKGVLFFVALMGLWLLVTLGVHYLEHGNESYDGNYGVVSNNYAQFQDNAEAGFMQIVTIPEPDGVQLNDFGYMQVNRDAGFTGHHMTYAVSSFYEVDARTQSGCYETWRWDTPPTTTKGFGEAFCISDYTMEWLFENGAYALEYEGY